MRILFITDYLPYPQVSGDRIRVYNLIVRLARRHDVLVAALFAESSESVRQMRALCRRVEVVAATPQRRLSRLTRFARYALAGLPPELSALHADGLARAVRRLSAGCDLIHVEPSRMALYQQALPPGLTSPRLLTFHNIEADQYGQVLRVERSIAQKLRLWLHSAALRRWEARYAEQFDRCIVVSADDRERLRAGNPRLAIDVVPNGVDTARYRPLPPAVAPADLLFIGSMSYPPCSDAALLMAREILPRVRLAVPSANLWIVGRDPPPELLGLQADGVHVTGRVDDVLPYYERCGVCVVPLRAGGGTRLKILEAMALGRPVVSSRVGCEGLDVVHAEHLFVADEPAAAAEWTVRLLRDEQLYQRIAAAGRALVVTRYDWDTIVSQLEGVYVNALARSARSSAAHGAAVRASHEARAG